MSASYLFLRPAIIGSLKRSIPDPGLLKRILAPFERAHRSPIRPGAGGGTSLPTEVRRAELERIRALAERHGLQLRICGCKNDDITAGKCHLTNLTTTARTLQPKNNQPTCGDDVVYSPLCLIGVWCNKKPSAKRAMPTAGFEPATQGL